MTNFNFILTVDGQEIEYGFDYETTLAILCEYARILDGLYQIYDADLNCIQTIDARPNSHLQLVDVGAEYE
jgi:hypothetical protein